MCRLAIFGPGASGRLDFRTVSRGLTQLERSCGGDGNGYYIPETGELQKEVDLSPGEVALASAGVDGMTMFHTRWATAGGVEDHICHPFDAGRFVLMHNGHFSGWYDYRKREDSDTQVVARVVGERGPGVLTSPTIANSGTFIVHDGKGALVIPTGGYDFYFQWREDGSFFHASEYVREFGADEIMRGTPGNVYRVTDDGEVTVTKIKRRRFPRRKRPAIGKGKSKNRAAGTSKLGQPFGSHKTRPSESDWERWAHLAELDDGGGALMDWEREELARLDAALERDDFFDGIKTTKMED